MMHRPSLPITDLHFLGIPGDSQGLICSSGEGVILNHYHLHSCSLLDRFNHTRPETDGKDYSLPKPQLLTSYFRSVLTNAADRIVGVHSVISRGRCINTGFNCGAVSLQDIHIVDNNVGGDVKYVVTFDSKCCYISDLQLFDGLSFFADD